MMNNVFSRAKLHLFVDWRFHFLIFISTTDVDSFLKPFYGLTIVSLSRARTRAFMYFSVFSFTSFTFRVNMRGHKPLTCEGKVKDVKEMGEKVKEFFGSCIKNAYICSRNQALI